MSFVIPSESQNEPLALEYVSRNSISSSSKTYKDANTTEGYVLPTMNSIIAATQRPMPPSM